MSDAVWYSFECLGECSPPSGVVVNLRLPMEDRDDPRVACPVCQAPMHYRGYWEASEGGFGAAGDHPSLANQQAAAWIEATTARWEQALMAWPQDAEAIRDFPRLPPNVSIGGFLAALRGITWPRS